MHFTTGKNELIDNRPIYHSIMKRGWVGYNLARERLDHSANRAGQSAVGIEY